MPVAFSLYTKAAKKTVKLAKTAAILVAVDAVSKGKPVVLGELVKGKRKKVTTAKLDKNSIAQIKVKETKKGSRRYRVYKAADSTHVAGTSKDVEVVVK